MTAYILHINSLEKDSQTSLTTKKQEAIFPVFSVLKGVYPGEGIYSYIHCKTALSKAGCG